ncbi:MAG TPA: DnaJ C-terminal domain-containing protein [Xanthobacteraceae bacterium]|nr:DnaJ C-terminal domain-containing protein [Xanthobacteraceae bacterium]
MAADPYKTLGVGKGASQSDIRKAYRRLAKKLHPDLNPGNKEAEEQFKAISAAYDLLGDPDKRARFDRGEIDTAGAERQQRFYRDFSEAGGPHVYTSDAGFADFGHAEDILSELFGRRGAGGRREFRMRGQDAHYRLEVDFLDAINGAKKQLTLDGQTLDVTIPPGTRDGQILRLRGQGRLGTGGGPSGDALIEIGVRPHPLFRREGDDIHIDFPVPLEHAVLGGKASVRTPTGTVTMAIPKWANTGTVLRLKGKGVPRPDGSRGDEYVTVKVMLPDKPDPDLERAIFEWRDAQRRDSRRRMEA